MTTVVPPVAGTNQIPVLDLALQTWSLEADYRTEIWYDKDTGAEVYFPTIGQAPTSNHVSTPPFILSEALRLKTQEMSYACSEEIYEKFTSSVLGTPHFYNLGRHDQSNLAALVLKSTIQGVGGEPYKFMCSDNIVTPDIGVWARRDHTTQQIQDLHSESTAFIYTCLDKHDLRRQEMAAATTQAEFDLIVWI